MDDLEAARYISEALMNLPRGYPNRDAAHRAFGRLILGRLGLRPMEGYITYAPYRGCRWFKGCKWWLIKPYGKEVKQRNHHNPNLTPRNLV